MNENQIVTPWGRAAFARLDTPDTKYNPLGKYSITFLLDAGPAADDFLADIDRRFEANYQEQLAAQRADKPKLADIKRADKPYKHQIDRDTGEELPGWRLVFSCNAAFKRSENEPKVDLPRPGVVGMDGRTPLAGRVGGGSIIRVSATVNGMFSPKDGAMIFFRLQGVQVKTLIQPGQVADLGFDAVEGADVSEVLIPPTADEPPTF